MVPFFLLALSGMFGTVGVLENRTLAPARALDTTESKRVSLRLHFVSKRSSFPGRALFLWPIQSIGAVMKIKGGRMLHSRLGRRSASVVRRGRRRYLSMKVLKSICSIVVLPWGFLRVFCHDPIVGNNRKINLPTKVKRRVQE